MARPGAGGRSAEVALDGVARAGLGVVRIVAVLALGAALAEEVPALVQLDLDGLEARVLVGVGDLPGGMLGAELVLLGHQLVDPAEEGLVIGHRIGRGLPVFLGRWIRDSLPSRLGLSVPADWVCRMSRFRLYPGPAQQASLLEQCGHARYVRNLALEQWSMWTPSKGATPGYVERARQLTAARAVFGWLRAGSQMV